MKSINRAPRTTSGMLEWVDRVQMTESDREIAKNQVRMSEAVIDAAWRAAGYVRALLARRSARHGKAGGKMGCPDRIAPHLH